MSQRPSLFISCGELSGDLAIAELLKPLFSDSLISDRITGVIGPHLASLGVHPFATIEGLQVMGYSAVIKALPLIHRHMNRLTNHLLKLQPDTLICVDYPGFHLRWVKKLREKGYQGRIIQYICPSIWAYKKERIEQLEAYYDEVWGILPFERPLLEQRKILYRYVGNPSLHVALDQAELRGATQSRLSELTEQLTEQPNKRLGLFPGSRKSEVKRHLPLLLKAAALIEEKQGSQEWQLFIASESLKEMIHKQITAFAARRAVKLKITFIEPENRLTEIQRLHAALAVSGTVCLELALARVPTVAIYEVSYCNYLIAKYLLRLQLRAYTVPNILLNSFSTVPNRGNSFSKTNGDETSLTLLPELIGHRIQPVAIASTLLEWLQSKTSLENSYKALDQLMHHMQEYESSQLQVNDLFQALESLKKSGKASLEP